MAGLQRKSHYCPQIELLSICTLLKKTMIQTNKNDSKKKILDG